MEILKPDTVVGAAAYVKWKNITARWKWM